MIGRCLMGLAALALVAARPDTYRENEEFKYARSSTDEGTKSGFYEAQRGNVGGNYERAHNMDRVAQGQMSDIVTQVGGQAGEVADARHGELYGSAFNSGVYGQRQWDTTNLAGRSFQETAGSHSAYSGSAASSSTSQRGSSVSSYGGGGSSALVYGQYDRAQGRLVDAAVVDGSTLQQTGASSAYGGRSYGSSQHSSSSGYQQHSGSSQRAEGFDQGAITSDQGSQYRIVPVRVVVRPLTPVRVPFTRDQVAGSTFSQTDEERSRAQSQGSITQSDGRVYAGGAPATGGLGGKERHYESSYDYHKEWEKHSEVTPIPLSIVTSNPLSEPVTSYSQQQLLSQQDQHRSQSQSRRASDTRYVSGSRDYSALDHQTGAQSAYQYQRVAEPIGQQYVVLSRRPEFVVTGTRQGSYGASQSQHASDYSAASRSQSHTAYGDESRTQGQLRTSDDSLLAASTRSRDALSTIAGGDRHIDSSVGTGPKSYESSYSYHKAWERQGDPYVIVPASSGTAGQSERLQTSSRSGYGAQQTRHSSYGSHSGTQEDCDESQRRVRSAHYTTSTEDLGQQVQTSWRDQEDLGQQTVDLEQHVASARGIPSNPTSSQGLSHLEDLGQHTQEDLGQQVVDLGQQLESSRETSQDFSQQQDLGQQAQEDLGQQTVDLEQQVVSSRGQSSNPTASQGLSLTEDVRQQNQEDLGQQVVDLGHEGEWEHRSKPAATHSLSHTEEVGQQSQDLGQRVVSQHVANPSQSFSSQQDLAQRPETYRSHRTEQAGMTDEELRHTQFGQTQVRHHAQEQWIGNDEYMRQMQQAARELESFAQQNGKIDDKHHETRFVHSDSEKHYLQEGRQSAHSSFAHAEHEDGWEEVHHHQQQQTYGYHNVHDMQHSWRPLVPEASEFNRTLATQHSYTDHNKTLPFGQETTQGYGQQQTFNNFGPYNEDEATQLSDKSEKDHYIPKEGSIVLAPINDKERSEPILRGDLGTSDTSTDLTSSTSVKSLTEDELAQHLDFLLSHANKPMVSEGSPKEAPTSYYIPDKVKTVEEIDSLSLVKDLDKSTEQTDKKSDDFAQHSVDDGKLEFMENKSDSYSFHFNSKPEMIGQELESLGQQITNETQQTVNTDISYAKSEYTGTAFDRKPEDQILEDSAQVFGRVHQQTEDLGQQVANLDEMGQETLSLDQQSTRQDDTGISFDRKPEDQTLENSAPEHQQTADLGQQEAVFDKTGYEMGQETLSLDQHFTGQESQDLHNWGETGQQTYSLDQQMQDFGQQSESIDRKMEFNYFEQHQQSEDFGQQMQSFDQETTKPKISRLEVQPLEIEKKESSVVSLPLEEKPLDSRRKDDSKDGLLDAAEESSTAKSESPGFWKSVGHKITVAKDKVSCWFSKCA